MDLYGPGIDVKLKEKKRKAKKIYTSVGQILIFFSIFIRSVN
jgi:hypothetical protein